jgi:hypothetical protein
MGRQQEAPWKGMPAGKKVKRVVQRALALPHEALQMGQRKAREYIWKKMSPGQRAKYMLLKVTQKVLGA